MKLGSTYKSGFAKILTPSEEDHKKNQKIKSFDRGPELSLMKLFVKAVKIFV
jgi:hypothetical protein